VDTFLLVPCTSYRVQAVQFILYIFFFALALILRWGELSMIVTQISDPILKIKHLLVTSLIQLTTTLRKLKDSLRSISFPRINLNPKIFTLVLLFLTWIFNLNDTSDKIDSLQILHIKRNYKTADTSIQRTDLFYYTKIIVSSH